MTQTATENLIFADNLSSCTPYGGEPFLHEGQEFPTGEIWGMLNSKCVYTEPVVAGIWEMECKYSEAQRKKQAQYYQDNATSTASAPIEIRSVTTGAFSEEGPESDVDVTFNGVEEDPSFTMLEDGTCSIHYTDADKIEARTQEQEFEKLFKVEIDKILSCSEQTIHPSSLVPISSIALALLTGNASIS